MPGVVGLVQADPFPVAEPLLTQLTSGMVRGNGQVWHRLLPNGLLARVASEAFRDAWATAEDPTGRFVSLVDGHVDNVAELEAELGLARNERVSTAAIILEGFARWGMGLLKRLVGDFQAVIVDSHEGSVTIATDPAGMRPLYFAHQGGSFAFAAEVKALAALPWVSRAPDFAGISSFLQHGFPLGRHTFFEKITLLPGASYAQFRNGDVAVKRYWRMQPSSRSARSEEEAVDAFVDLWRDAIRRSTAGKERVGTLLSGGLDSRLILAGILGAGYTPKTFTFGDRGCSDERIARELASLSGAGHRFQAVDPDAFGGDVEEVVDVTDGMFNYVHSGVRNVLPMLASEVDVVFDGITLLDSFFYAIELPLRALSARPGDELRWLKLALMDGGDPRSLEVDRDERVNLLRGPELGRGFSTDDYLREYAREASEVSADPVSLLCSFDMELRQQRFTGFGPALLRSVVPVRCPFLDRRVMDLGASMAPRYRSKDKFLQARALDRLAPELAAIPWLRTGLPVNAGPLRYNATLALRAARSLMRRVSNGRLGALPSSDVLVDQAGVLRRRPVFDRVERALAQDTAQSSGFFESGSVKRLLESHRSGARDHSEIIGRLLTIETWYRRLGS